MWKCYIKTFDYTFKETGALVKIIFRYLIIYYFNYKNIHNLLLKFIQGAFLHDNEDELAFEDDYAGISHDKIGLFIGRWIFDNLFNISLVLVMVNIVVNLLINIILFLYININKIYIYKYYNKILQGGIIIDTFRSLRELYN